MKSRKFEYLKESRNEVFATLFLGLYKKVPNDIVLVVKDIKDPIIFKAYRENGVRFSKSMLGLDEHVWKKIDDDTYDLSENILLFSDKENLHLFQLLFSEICILVIDIPGVIKELKEKKLIWI